MRTFPASVNPSSLRCPRRVPLPSVIRTTTTAKHEAAAAIAIANANTTMEGIVPRTEHRALIEVCHRVRTTNSMVGGSLNT